MQWFNGSPNNLATLARETGYPVVEVDGWRDRGHGGFADYVGGTVIHHTATCEPEETEKNAPTLNVVTYGRSDLPGPLCNYLIGFDGTVYVVAAGTAWHAGSGNWNGLDSNAEVVGIEAEDAGDGDWTQAQLDVYPRLCARICWFLGTDADSVCGHKEWAPERKGDPAGIDMNKHRSRVQFYLDNPSEVEKTGMTKEEVKQAVREVLNEPRYESRVEGSDAMLSLVDAVMNTDRVTYNESKQDDSCKCSCGS